MYIVAGTALDERIEVDMLDHQTAAQYAHLTVGEIVGMIQLRREQIELAGIRVAELKNDMEAAIAEMRELQTMLPTIGSVN